MTVLAVAVQRDLTVQGALVGQENSAARNEFAVALLDFVALDEAAAAAEDFAAVQDEVAAARGGSAAARGDSAAAQEDSAAQDELAVVVLGGSAAA